MRPWLKPHAGGAGMIRSLCHKSRSWLACFYRCGDGNIAVEFAFVLPILLLLAAGAFDFGMGFNEKLRLEGAARAGAQYALYNGDKAEDSAGVIQSARDDANDTAEVLTVTPVYYCTCLDGSQIACDGSCAGGEVPLRYIQVDVSRTLDLMFDYPLISDPLVIQGHAEMRLR